MGWVFSRGVGQHRTKDEVSGVLPLYQAVLPNAVPRSDSFAKEQYQAEVDKKKQQAQKVEDAKKTLKASADVDCSQGGHMDAEYYDQDDSSDNRRG
jgi:hypothetical protein